MNKYLAWLPALMVFGTAIYMPVKEATKVKTTDKSISFAVYKGNSYTAEAYNYTSAQVHIIVEKVNTKGKRTVVWNKNLDARYLKQYPLMSDAIEQKIIVPNVNEKKEHLEIRYVLTYDSEGSELQMQDGVVVSGKGSSKVDISI